MAETQTEESQESKRPFNSKLSHGRERFLAHVIEHALKNGRRSPQDFIRHFPPSAVMAGLRDRPSLRANILVTATGVKSRIAVKKTAESAGEDLQIALDEGETNADVVVGLFDPDDRVRYLSDKALWKFLIEGEFWEVSSVDAESAKRATEHVAYMLDRALKDELITHRDIIDGISVQRIAEVLPRGELEKIITAALTAGQKKQPFTESTLVDTVSSQTLLEHVPLKDIWNTVIVIKIAEAHGFVETPGAEAETKPAESKPGEGKKAAQPASGAKSGSGAAASAFRASNGAATQKKSNRPAPEGGVDLDVDLDLDDITKEVEASVGE